MPRPKTILQSQFPYHVRGRSHNRDWFNIPLEDVWQIMTRELYFLNKAYQVKIHSFVLLNNHFHLIISTPEANIDKALWYFMTNVSREINFQAGTINQVFGSRYFKCVIESYHYYVNAYKYVYRNPVQAGIVQLCEDYSFSTLHGLLGASHLLVPMEEDTLLFPSVEENLRWLNEKPDEDLWLQVGLALSKNKFTLAKNNSNKANLLETNAL
jgi:REP element-mobilizing transposase RayT